MIDTHYVKLASQFPIILDLPANKYILIILIKSDLLLIHIKKKENCIYEGQAL